MGLQLAVDVADLVGTRFRPGGRERATGLDCYGLLLTALRRMGLNPPDPYAVDDDAGYRAFAVTCLAGIGDAWVEVPVAERRAGDALLMAGRHHPEGHVAVYLDDARVLHTTPATGCLCLPWARLSRHVKRIVRLAVA